MSLASATHAYWHSARAIELHRDDPVRLDLAIANLRAVARHSPSGKLRDMARERLAKVERPRGRDFVREAAALLDRRSEPWRDW